MPKNFSKSRDWQNDDPFAPAAAVGMTRNVSRNQPDDGRVQAYGDRRRTTRKCAAEAVSGDRQIRIQIRNQYSSTRLRLARLRVGADGLVAMPRITGETASAPTTRWYTS